MPVETLWLKELKLPFCLINPTEFEMLDLVQF